MIIPGNKIQFTSIKGTLGRLKMPNNPYTLKFLQSAISSLPKYQDQHQILKSLKPLRNRIEMSSIGTIDDVLQRDINDARVARDMIPYLLDTIDKPVFFPSVVILLFPNSNFEGENEYPTVEKISQSKYKYQEFWEYEHYPDDEGIPSYLGELRINLNQSSPAAIDGQHRTTAFRWLSKVESGSAEVYDNFYNDLDCPIQFDADLPVTFVWFERENSEIDIKRIARNIFIDINQSSQQISKSRHILMNNNQPAEFITRRFYNFLAEKGFKPSKDMNLMYAGFDFPYDVSRNSNWSPNTLFVPEIFSYSMSWLLFAKAHFFTNLSRDKVGRESGHNGKYFFELALGENTYNAFIKTIKDIEENSKEIINLEYEQLLTNKLSTDFIPLLYKVINTNGFYKSIFNAFNTIDDNFTNPDRSPYINPTPRESWKHMFKDGEGLFYTIVNSNNPSTKDYKLAANTIINEVHLTLASDLNLNAEQSKKLIKSLQSVAYNLGYILSLNYFADIHDSYSEAAKKMELINKNIDWKIHYLAIEVLSKSYISSVDPKTWPSYRNIYLRTGHHFCSEINIYEDVNKDCLERNIEQFLILNNYLPIFHKEQELDESLAKTKSDVANKSFQIIREEEYLFFLADAQKETEKIINAIYGEGSYINEN